MVIETLLVVRQPRPQSWSKPRVSTRNKPGQRSAHSGSAQSGPVTGAVRTKRSARATSALPEGWARRLREQSHNLARAIHMLEQAVTMINEPKSSPLAQAECLRGAGLLTLVAASELLVVAGWFEADQAVNGGTLEG